MQIRYAASHVQHMQKALEQMNVKLTEVLADITGLTGRLIIEAILAGERNPRELATLRNVQCHNDEETIAKALETPAPPARPPTARELKFRRVFRARLF